MDMDSSMDFSKPKLSYGVVSWQTWVPKTMSYKLEGKLHIMDFSVSANRSARNRTTLCGKKFDPGVIAGATMRSDSEALMRVLVLSPDMCQICRRSLEAGGAGFILIT